LGFVSYFFATNRGKIIVKIVFPLLLTCGLSHIQDGCFFVTRAFFAMFITHLVMLAVFLCIILTLEACFAKIMGPGKHVGVSGVIFVQL
jgi:hypothetical protein